VNAGRVSEDTLTRKLRRRWPLIGDDCAVIPARTLDLLFTTDLSVEGVHFTRASSAREIGYRALARGLSDIAAMGGTPLICLISFAIAPWTDRRWIGEFYRGLERLLRKTKTELAGGDISHARQFVCDVVLWGAVEKGKALLRSGARPGDMIYVSGPLGGWQNKRSIVPRLDAGRELIGTATACMDISDGLALDLHRLAKASGVEASIESVPLLRGASMKQALHDGEDYELLYTAPPERKAPGIPIGTIVQGKAGRVTHLGKPVPPLGYDHFGKHRS
jgi:thiamine-monophosphate kinase